MSPDKSFAAACGIAAESNKSSRNHIASSHNPSFYNQTISNMASECVGMTTERGDDFDAGARGRGTRETPDAQPPAIH